MYLSLHLKKLNVTVTADKMKTFLFYISMKVDELWMYMICEKVYIHEHYFIMYVTQSQWAFLANQMTFD